jgi:ankyrin repeat protein
MPNRKQRRRSISVDRRRSNRRRSRSVDRRRTKSVNRRRSKRRRSKRRRSKRRRSRSVDRRRSRSVDRRRSRRKNVSEFLKYVKRIENPCFIAGQFNKNLLMEAIEKEDIDAVNYLITRCRELIHRKDTVGMNILMYTGYCKNTNIFNILFSLYDDIPRQLKMRDHEGNTVFLHAVSGGNLNIIKKIIHNGAKIDDVDNEGETALMASYRNLENFNYLCRLGADINTEDKKADTVLMRILSSPWINQDEKEIITYLINSGAKVKNTNNVSLLMAAVKSGRLENVKFLFDRYMIDVNEQDNEGLTALMYLVKYNTRRLQVNHTIFPIIKLLLENGANEDLKDKSGNTYIDYGIKIPRYNFQNNLNRVKTVLAKEKLEYITHLYSKLDDKNDSIYGNFKNYIDDPDNIFRENIIEFLV